MYRDEILDITSRTQKIPIMRQLRFYLDDQGLFRSGGRIDNAAICETAYPYLLPPHHPLTTLMIMDAHRQQNHIGINGIIVFIRQTFLDSENPTESKDATAFMCLMQKSSRTTLCYTGPTIPP